MRHDGGGPEPVSGLNFSTLNRAKIKVRDHHRCVVCGLPGEDVHHRRGRRRNDEHTHCPCNGVTLCGKGNVSGDHGWVHQHPFEARGLGLIISRHEERAPFEVPIKTCGGWFLLQCSGLMEPVDEPV